MSQLSIKFLKGCLLSFSLLFLTGFGVDVKAQLIQCDRGYFLRSSNYTIDEYNPVTNTVTPMGITSPGGGLAINKNYFNNGPDPTFYSFSGGNYFYWDGTAWVNTGHSVGSTAAANPGGAGPFIYNLDGVNGAVYRYDGTGPSSLFLTLPSWQGPYDCVGDENGNLYLFTTPGGTGNQVRIYDSSANLICSYELINCPASSAGGGFSVVNGVIYAEITGGQYIGTVTGPLQITMQQTNFTSFSSADHANCPFEVATSQDNTADICLGDTLSLTSPTSAANSGLWLNSNPSVVQLGDSGTIIGLRSGTSIVTYISSDSSSSGLGNGCLVQGGRDTVRTLVTVHSLPSVQWLNATSPIVLCSGIPASMAVTPANNYNHYSWYRDGELILGNNAPDYTSNRAGFYQVRMEDTFGCANYTDSIEIKIDSMKVQIDYTVLLGCDGDTVQIINNSDSGFSYLWDWGDGSVVRDTTRSPSHIYRQQGNYLISYWMKNDRGCEDSVKFIIKLNHPLAVDFSVSEDSLCAGVSTPVRFRDRSIGGGQYFWDFGDGHTSTDQHPQHQYHRAGIYQVQFVVSDSVPCFDTAYHLIFVDSLDQPLLTAEPKVICVGEETRLDLSYWEGGAKSMVWDFGDGITWTDQVAHQQYRYDRPGDFVAKVQLSYLVCPPAEDTVHIHVHPLPYVSLGRDTTLCLDGDPLVLSNLLVNQNEPGIKYQWSSGDTTREFIVRTPGVYWLRATSLFDCSTTDYLNVEKDCYVDIPNAFTPNGDGVNDYFFPRQLLSKGVASFSMTIYNRWGQKIFESSKADGRGWDGRYNGKDQAQGVYVYLIEVTYQNGRQESYKGNVTLIR